MTADDDLRPPKPEPIACQHCGRLSDWEWDGEEWMVEGEWWGKEPGQFYDRRRCYLIGTGQMTNPRPEPEFKPGWLPDQVAKSKATLDSLPPDLRQSLGEP